MKTKIGIIAPANSIVGEQSILNFKTGIKILEDNGFEVIIGKNVYSTSDGYCGTTKEKLDDIYEVTKKAKYILCATGGINSNNILNELDFNKIKNNIFIGNSNPILLFNSFYSINNQVSFIGPNVKTIGKMKSSFVIDSLKDKILNNSKKVVTEEQNIVIKEGTASGISIGGNIQSLRRIIGTKYFPNVENSIFYIEADPTETNHTEFYSIINQFIQANVFEKCNGIIVGSYDSLNFIKDVFKNFNLPIVMCKNMGHNVNNNMMPIGKKIEIKKDGSIDEL